jgi:hypothetical protein
MEEAMKTVLELNKPVKTRQPCEVTITQLRAEIKELKACNRIVRKANLKLMAELSDERAHTREMLRIARVKLFRAFEQHMCTCTPARADYLRRDDPGY